MPKPKNKGKVKYRNGKPVLVSMEGNPYEITEITLRVWKKCDGRTETGDIASALVDSMTSSKVDTAKVKKAVYTTIKQLKEVGLIEYG